MSICSPCLQVQPIPVCTQEMVIGTISDTNASLTVYFQDVTTQLIQGIAGESDNAGLVTVDVSDMEFASTHAYEIWVTTAGGGYKDKIMVTIGANQSDTICARFEEVKDAEGAIEMFTTQTLIEA